MNLLESVIGDGYVGDLRSLKDTLLLRTAQLIKGHHARLLQVRPTEWPHYVCVRLRRFDVGVSEQAI